MFVRDSFRKRLAAPRRELLFRAREKERGGKGRGVGGKGENDRARNRKNENCEKSYHTARVGIKFFLHNSLFFSRVMVILTRFCSDTSCRRGIPVILRTRRRLGHVSGLPSAPGISVHVLHIRRPEHIPFVRSSYVPHALSRESQMTHIRRIMVPRFHRRRSTDFRRVDKKTDVPLPRSSNPTSCAWGAGLISGLPIRGTYFVRRVVILPTPRKNCKRDTNLDKSMN